MTSSATLLSEEEIKCLIKEEFSMKRTPRTLNLFYFFLSIYKLDLKKTSENIYHKNYLSTKSYYDTTTVYESDMFQNMFVVDSALNYISTTKLKNEFGLRTNHYKPWFLRFTKTIVSHIPNKRCARFQWKPEAHKFFRPLVSKVFIPQSFFERMNGGSLIYGSGHLNAQL